MFVLFSFFLSSFIILFSRFKRVPSSRLPRQTIIRPRPPNRQLRTFNYHTMRIRNLTMFLRTTTKRHTTHVHPSRSLPNVRFQLIFLRMTTRHFKLRPRLNNSLYHQRPTFFRPTSNFNVFNLYHKIMFPSFEPIR